MAPQENINPAARLLLIVASFTVVVAGMRAAAQILVPFFLAVFLAVAVAPPMFWLRRNRVPAALALAIVAAGLVLFMTGLVLLVGKSVTDFSGNLPAYQAVLMERTADVTEWVRRRGIDFNGQRIFEVLDPGAAMKLVTRFLAGLGGVLTNALLIFATVIFLLLEASSFDVKLRAVLKDPATSFGYFDTFLRNIQRYMAIKTAVSLATGVAIALWLFIIGADFPFLWGLLAFLFNYVPNIGSILAAVPAVLLALVQLGPGGALLAALGFLVVNILVGFGIEPRVMGRGLGLSTLVVFLSLVFWGWVLGPVGMLLSVPLTMTMKIALDSYEGTRWIAVLLGPEISSRPPPADESS